MEDVAPTTLAVVDTAAKATGDILETWMERCSDGVFGIETE